MQNTLYSDAAQYLQVNNTSYDDTLQVISGIGGLMYKRGLNKGSQLTTSVFSKQRSFKKSKRDARFKAFLDFIADPKNTK